MVKKRYQIARPVNRVAIIGTGVIGASWAALFLAKGLHVCATDIAPGAEASLKSFIGEAWPALTRLGLSSSASRGNLTFEADLAKALSGADFVRENGPERIQLKHELYGKLDELLPPDVKTGARLTQMIKLAFQLGDLAPGRADDFFVGM